MYDIQNKNWLQICVYGVAENLGQFSNKNAIGRKENIHKTKKLHQYAKSLLNCQTKKKTKQDKTREVVMLKIYREISKW